MNKISRATLECFVDACHVAVFLCLFLALISPLRSKFFAALSIGLMGASVAAGAMANRSERQASRARAIEARATAGAGSRAK